VIFGIPPDVAKIENPLEAYKWYAAQAIPQIDPREIDSAPMK